MLLFQEILSLSMDISQQEEANNTFLVFPENVLGSDPSRKGSCG